MPWNLVIFGKLNSILFFRFRLICALSGIWALTSFVGSFPIDASPSEGTSATMVIFSPRHPASFYFSGNDKLSQELRWNKETQTLEACVTYSLVSGGGDDEDDPSNYKTFELPFPTVKLDQNNNLIAFGRQNRAVHLGHLEGGIFGPKVVLNDNVKFSAHRRNGSLSAKIIVSER